MENFRKTYVAFYVRVPHTKLEELIETMEKHVEEQSYMIVKETTGGDHFHVLWKIDKVAYATYQQKIFRRKWKLNGTAKNGSTRQYGRVKKIKSFEQIVTYMLKDQDKLSNVITKNFPLKQIDLKRLKEKSFSKSMSHRELRDKEVAEYVSSLQKNLFVNGILCYESTEEELMETLEIAKVIGKIYINHRFKPPVMTTIERILGEAGVINMDNYLENYYGKWIKPRLRELEHRNMDKKEWLEFQKWKVQKNNVDIYYNDYQEEV